MDRNRDNSENLKQISVTILAKNSQKYIQEVIKALTPFGEVLLYDTGSTDATLEYAKKFPNVKIICGPFIGFGPTHNVASGLAQHDWILSVDSDEVVTKEMVDEISKQVLDANAVYSFPRRNFFNGKFIKWCGWYPDRQTRLYQRHKTRFSDHQVHEGVICEGMRQISMQEAMVHYSYDSIADFLAKMQSYSTLFAEQNKGKRQSSPLKALMHGSFAFFKSYIIKRGFLGGYEGLVISAYNGHTAYYKYMKLYEANLRLK